MTPSFVLRRLLPLAMFAGVSCDNPQAPFAGSSTDRFASISAGSGLACGVGLDGYAYCWGGNDAAQAGSPSHDRCLDSGLRTMPCVQQPQRVGLQQQVTKVFAGFQHACALTADGTAYCWGANDQGQLGRGTNGAPQRPGLVASSARFSEIVVGWRHTCALATDGVAWCWGMNDYGQLGRGVNDILPHPVPAAITSELRFYALGRGLAHHTCGVAISGGAWCWGVNESESLGATTTETCLSNPFRFYGDFCATRPIRALPDLALDAVTLGELHGCGRVPSSGWICWGSATNGNLGIGTPQDCVTTANGIEYHTPCNRDRVPVVGSTSFIEMHAGSLVTCAIDQERRGWCWGGPTPWGSLGTGVAEQMSDIPVPVAGDIRFTALSVGPINICGLAADGAAFCWGYARSGAIGDGRYQEASIDVPTRVLRREN